MSSKPILPNEAGAVFRKKSAEPRKEFLAWEYYRGRTFANFAREVYDLPNATVSINVGQSAGWAGQLAGITNGSVNLAASGSDFLKPIRVNRVVGTGIFRGVAKAVLSGQGTQAGTILFEGPADALYFNDEVAALLGTVEQITMVEPLDPTKLAQRAVLQEYSLTAQLRRLRKLQAGWDGESAPAIPDETGGTAEEVIKQIHHAALMNLVPAEVRLGPLPDGTLRFECRYSNKELFLTISGKDVEIQGWQPLDAVEATGYGRTDAAGVGEHLEWLVK